MKPDTFLSNRRGKMMQNAVNTLSKEVRDKLIALDKVTSRLWDMATDDPEYMSLHAIGKQLQGELTGYYGLTPQQINSYSYGEGGVING